MRSPRRERGGNAEERRNTWFWHTVFRKRRARAWGERKTSPQAPHGRAPEGNRPPRRSATRFGDASARIAFYLIGIARAARGRLFFAPRGGLAENTSKEKTWFYERALAPPATLPRTRRDERTVVKKHHARKAPRSQFFIAPTFHPPCLLTLFQRCLFASFHLSAVFENK